MLSRRHFLQATAAGLMAAGTGRLTLAAGLNREPLILSAVDDPAGKHFIAGIDLQGRPRFRLPVADRCHGGCARPASDQALLFARRPGRHFYVVDTARGETVATIAAGTDHHFYGHGVFSPDGRFLYVTMNHYTTSEGLVRVYDADRNYRAVRDMPVDGIGPHELRLHPDGETLIVALGGIETHPDYDRIKLNLDTMQPALLLMDRHSGKIRERHEPSHHQLSCRHLDVSPDGIVIAGYQYQGPEWETPPLIARLDTRRGTFDEISLPDDLQPRLRNYTASIACSHTGPYTVVTAPRGGLVVVINHATGALVRHLDVADVAGALPLADDSFVVSSGNGSVQRIHADSAGTETLSHSDMRWDNHLTLFG
ncbi:DUF1513 domain-containing protein [Marinobacter sp. JSM 1782161]|uniref:DUF1513 domain-containing protein n=1 Tax=Marinobacter sp. JSM 1782161 TaxID=2685906 RepID=UPI00140398B9|nr:DUF1513 domain-containing protein [Marinobacter sp. JSM 1782161]